MTFAEMEQAIDLARNDLQRADRLSTSLARLLVGRLRKVDSDYVLAQLKTELRDFNAHTKSWKK